MVALRNLAVWNRLKVLRMALACLCDPAMVPPQLLVAFLQRRSTLAQDLRLTRKDRLVVLLLLVPGGLVALVVMVLLLGRSLWALLKLLLPIKTQDMAMVKMEGTALVVMVLLVGSNLLPLAMVFLQLVKMEGTALVVMVLLVGSNQLPLAMVFLLLQLVKMQGMPMIKTQDIVPMILLLMFLDRLQDLLRTLVCLQDRLLVRRHIVGPRTNLTLSGGIVIMGMHQIFKSLSALGLLHRLQACHARGLATLRGP